MLPTCEEYANMTEEQRKKFSNADRIAILTAGIKEKDKNINPDLFFGEIVTDEYQ